MPSRIGEETRRKIQAAWPDILERVGDGQPLNSICALYDFSRSSVYAYRRMSGPDVQQAFEDAMKDGAWAALDDAMETISNSDLDPRFARVRADTLLKIAEKRSPEVMGARVKADINVKHIDLGQVITDANKRLASHQQGRIIEGVATQVAEDMALPDGLRALL